MDDKINFTIEEENNTNLSVDIAYINRVSYILSQNQVPIISKIRITNDMNQRENVKYIIRSEEPFIKEYEHIFGTLNESDTIEFLDIDIKLDDFYFSKLEEKKNTTIEFQLIDLNTSEKIYATDLDITLLPKNHWLGTRILPSLTAGFVSPNSHEVKRIVSQASEFLFKWTDDPSFTGYQTRNPEVVRTQVAAIYAACQKENIAYTNPPASFEKFGQKIRFPEEIIKYKQGTCIDLALLFCSCIESVGIRPLIIFTKNHAFAGYWLDEKVLTHSYDDDITTLTKRMSRGINDIELIETTAFVVGKNIDFENAVKMGEQHLLKGNEFEGLIDIYASRLSNITPLAHETNSENEYKANHFGERVIISEKPNSAIQKHTQILDLVKGRIDKKDIWSKSLLDLTLRNPLLNFKGNKSTLQLMIHDLALIEDELATNQSFKVIPKMEKITHDLVSNNIYSVSRIKNEFHKLIEEDFKEYRIRSYETEYALEKRLKEIYRKTKLSIEENGSNTLYIALGFLKWFESDISQRPYYAPLILLPVELTKKRAGSAYEISMLDEEPQLNITLLEYLKQNLNIDIRGLTTLPMDEKGIDIPLLFSTIRNAIMNKKRWDIEEYVFIGNFSFNKYVMWNDLQKRENEIVENKIVKSLVNGKSSFEEYDSLRIDQFDEKYKPIDIVLGSDVDSSQLSAVVESTNDKSFVLHGPPGTGKSQTITNMIIANLYKGKKIIFVAEKMAALNVVYNRLSKLGLEDYCLELHSNKTNKKDVLEKIGKTISNSVGKNLGDINSKSENISDMKKELNNYVQILHQKNNGIFTLYELIKNREKYSYIKSEIKLDKESLKKIDSNLFENIQYQMNLLDYYKEELNLPLYQHPLKNFNFTEYKLSDRENFINRISDISQNINELKFFLKENEMDDARFDSLKKTNELSNLIDLKDSTTLSKIPNKEILDNTYSSNVHNYNKLAKLLIEYRSNKDEIERLFEKTIYEINPNELKLEFEEAEEAFFLFKGSKRKKLFKKFQLEAKSTEQLNIDSMQDYISLLKQFKENKLELEERKDEFNSYFGDLYNSTDTHLDYLKMNIEFSNKINEYQIKEKREKNDLLDDLKLLMVKSMTICSRFRDLNGKLIKLVKEFDTTYKIDESLFYTSSFEEVLSQSNNWSKGIIDFKTWSLMNVSFNILESCLKNNFKMQLLNIDSKQNIYDIFLKSYTDMMIDDFFETYPVLNMFSGYDLNKKISILKDKEKEFKRISIELLNQKLAHNITETLNAGSNEEESAYLRKVIRSKGRGTAVRSIFNKTSNIIQTICPVMLMSPLSIAQYIDPKFPKYDLIIFDEASQIPTSIAVGPISRANNCIVVGDPKQMPPTSFFSSNNMDEDNIELEDLESLLDDCLAVNLPEKHLQWHYRSNHESLINFSNVKYYDDSLKTFPSLDALTTKVSFTNVNGLYSRGSTRTNKAEAEAIVKEIVSRLSDEKQREISIGVVTFNQSQQNLIDDLIQEAFVKQPELETININAKEPIFIKNLENVQGDERDLILFSTTFGKDEDGKMTMNFGPLNNNGGWRRLNVAVTRARKEMKVFSSFDPEAIDLNRTRAEGVVGLKSFLEYARNPKTLVKSNNFNQDNNNLIIHKIKEELLKNGFDCEINVGGSEFKIDVAVKNPKNKNEFIMAILLDGKTYSSAPTATDRNIIQPEALRRLKWHVHRVWSIDWLDNKEKVIKEIIKELTDIVN